MRVIIESTHEHLRYVLSLTIPYYHPLKEEMRHGVFWRLWEHFMISIWNSITHPISDSYFSRME